eukprot:Rhum_TRINITY_DN14535_c4_g2::Rhum_TRINITY_DN14535_c4_g2_i1::g.98303::m.98303/K12618/XRN1, SEP1, KEM1; 5'-3' exoribonuclease 1
MGVPKFFRFFAERYPCVINSFDGEIPIVIDNLYLDANGIIHVCSHNNDDLQEALSTDEMARNMCNYIERLFSVAQPQKNFVICVDGVAPRAKMNQQRQRRFRKESDTAEAVEKAKKEGVEVPESLFDSNMISPGTELMDLFCEHFKFFLQLKIQNDPSWQNVNVVFSGHDAPGEGEHKIMDFIRARRLSAGYDPDETHCLYGLDADLIHLALASHETHVVLLREVVRFEAMKDMDKKASLKRRGLTNQPLPSADQYVLLHIEAFRDYFRLDVSSGARFNAATIRWSQCSSDFVLMCCLVGNDFLPSLPHITIKDGAIPRMFQVYRDMLAQGRYLSWGKKIQWQHVNEFMRKLGTDELQIIQESEKQQRAYYARLMKMDPTREFPTVPHTMRVDDAKAAYYQSKFNLEYRGGAHGPAAAVVKQVATDWVTGIEFVWRYYTEGPPSWGWYFPHHYAPFCSDIGGLDLAAIADGVSFKQGSPLLPFQQLVGVLPPASIKRGLPSCYHDIPRSPAIRYAFPDTLDVDREGATSPWEGVVLIPFINEADILSETEDMARRHTPEEERRNGNRASSLFRYNAAAPERLLRSRLQGVPDVTVTVEHTDTFSPAQLIDPQVQAQAPAEGGPAGPPAGVHPGASVGFCSLFCDRNPGDHMRWTEVYTKPNVVTIFDKRTFKDSLFIKLPTEDTRSNERRYASMIGTRVWADWPNLRYAEVQSVTTVRATFTAAGTVTQHNQERMRNTERLFDEHKAKLLAKRGIHLDTVTVLVTVAPLLGGTLKGNALALRFGDDCLAYPIQLVVPADRWHPLPRSIPLLRALKSKRDDPAGIPIMLMPSTTHGVPDECADLIASVGRVVRLRAATKAAAAAGAKKSKPKQVVDAVLVQSKMPVPPMPAGFLECIDKSSWLTFPKLAEELNIPRRTVEAACGSIVTTTGFGEREIGLCLCLKDDPTSQSARLGFTMYVPPPGPPAAPVDVAYYMTMGSADDPMVKLAERTAGKNRAAGDGKGGRWLLSPAAQKVVADFFKEFPSFEKALQGQSTRDFDPAHLMSLNLTRVKPEAIVDRVQEWVQAKPHWAAKMVASGETMLPESVMEEMEASIVRNRAEFEAQVPADLQTRRFKLQTDARLADFFTPFFYSDGVRHIVRPPVPADTREIMRLGARVVNMKAVGAIPFGAYGTVTRLLPDGQTAELIMDQEHLGCSTLGGRLKTHRGCLVRRCYLVPIPSRPSKGVAEVAAELPEKAGVAAAAKAAVAKTQVTVADGVAKVGVPAAKTLGVAVMSPTSPLASGDALPGRTTAVRRKTLKGLKKKILAHPRPVLGTLNVDLDAAQKGFKMQAAKKLQQDEEWKARE